MNTPQEIFEELTQGLPRFDDGRINFTGIRKAPVLNVVVRCGEEILIVKRSEKVSTYQGLWNGVSGFIDEPKSIEEFSEQELHEELGITAEDIDEIKVCEPYEVEDTDINRVWFVYPVLAELKKKPSIKLDWEHTDFAWIKPADLNEYTYVKDFDKSINRVLS